MLELGVIRFSQHSWFSFGGGGDLVWGVRAMGGSIGICECVCMRVRVGTFWGVGFGDVVT